MVNNTVADLFFTGIYFKRSQNYLVLESKSRTVNFSFAVWLHLTGISAMVDRIVPLSQTTLDKIFGKRYRREKIVCSNIPLASIRRCHQFFENTCTLTNFPRLIRLLSQVNFTFESINFSLQCSWSPTRS